MDENKAKQTAALNDAFRAGFPKRGLRCMTAGVAALSEVDQFNIALKVQAFDQFTPDNDPHGEHDFGAFEHNSEKIFWKIDTFADEKMEYGAEDCTDPKAYRVLTIMLASEY